MKSLKTLFVILFLIFPVAASAQIIQTMGQSVINGSAVGATVASAAWLTENNGDPYDLDRLAYGVGAGMLGGIAFGLYDAFQSEGSADYAVKGTFNVSRNRAAIVLLDSFYGAGTGLVLSGALTLMSEDKGWSRIREGIGVGTWFGFGFGMVDALVLSKNVKVPASIGLMDYPRNEQKVQWAVGKSHLSNEAFAQVYHQPVWISTLSMKVRLK